MQNIYVPFMQSRLGQEAITFELFYVYAAISLLASIADTGMKYERDAPVHHIRATE
jgi:hypothetical protein